MGMLVAVTRALPDTSNQPLLLTVSPVLNALVWLWRIQPRFVGQDNATGCRPSQLPGIHSISREGIVAGIGERDGERLQQGAVVGHHIIARHTAAIAKNRIVPVSPTLI